MLARYCGAMTNVLTIGLVPEAVDFSQYPGLDADKLRAGLAAQMARFEAEGFAPTMCLVDAGETAEQVLHAALEGARFDVVVIGAGIRTAAPHFLLFERLLNLVHALAPGAKIAFNTMPGDTVDAAKRWAT